MNTYLIYGSDYGLIKRQIDKLTNNVKDVIKYDLSSQKVDELLDDALCISMFGNKKVLIGENAIFLTSNPTNVNHNIDYLNNYLEDKNHDNIVILSVISEKLDERKKIVKNLKKNAKVIQKETIDEKNLPNFVINEFKDEGYVIDYKTANYFVNYVSKNVDIILSEIKKMIMYKDDDKNISIDDVNAISSKGFNDNIFDLSNAIINKDFKKIFDILNDLMTLNEEPIKIISMLANQFILVYQSKLLSKKGKTIGEIAKTLEVHPYRVKLALETDYLDTELESILKKLHELDFQIKSGNVDKKEGLENFILHL